MSVSPMLTAYLGAARALAPVARRLLARRAARGKEDPARMGERFGRAGLPRPAAPLIWLHAASVGESLSLLPLIGALAAARPDLEFLVTTGTVTSARLMAERLPPRARHQFVPIDLLSAVRGFLDHWRPDLCIWVESELWPALIVEAAARGAPLALVNARMSERSARGWARWAPGMIAALLSRFALIAAQDAASADCLKALGGAPEKLFLTGSLKAGAAPPDLPEARAALASPGRPLWLAASTHAGEEDAAAEAHRIAAARIPGLLTLIAPRHPERGGAIAARFAAAGLKVTRRSLGDPPGGDIHLLDTLGEMGAWLRLAPVAFIGGSLAPHGGHNPHEPAALGAAILHGPDSANFAAEYKALDAAGGAAQVRDAAELGARVADLLGDARLCDEMTAAARAALGDGGDALARVMELLAPLLPPPAARGGGG